MPERVRSGVGDMSRRLEGERRAPTTALWVITVLVLAFWGLVLYLLLTLF